MASDGTLNALRERIARIFQASLNGEQISLKSDQPALMPIVGFVRISRVQYIKNKGGAGRFVRSGKGGLQLVFEGLIHCSWRPCRPNPFKILEQ